MTTLTTTPVTMKQKQQTQAGVEPGVEEGTRLALGAVAGREIQRAGVVREGRSAERKVGYVESIGVVPRFDHILLYLFVVSLRLW